MRLLTGPVARLSAATALTTVLFALFVLYGAGWSGFGLDDLVTGVTVTAVDASSTASLEGTTGTLSLERTPPEQTAATERYKYAISAVGLGWVVARTANHWRLSVRRFVAEPRRATLSSRVASSTAARRLRDDVPLATRLSSDRRARPSGTERGSLDHD
ncbi:hypothetical protein [Natronolimnohabitans innermongolicus]|uniref:Uncharacterized protein n=1 Tax=Natronolimnohabitans innermongolicus JCM 12255 TaxID=1227499 RepID=L9XH70_9EURY|nr:hypothetical protein [Natronolimnohabitans innermongolicus]ELY61084.1 hypothetical protein C493_03160 [Natronolimnohabitans innermongolicus JCM 12255]